VSELANSNHPWSDQDDSDLLDFVEHLNVRAAAEHLGRNIAECEGRLCALHRQLPDDETREDPAGAPPLA